MIIKVAIPNQIQLKVVPRFKSMFLAQKGEIHYIGGSEILPPPLSPVEESEAIHNLSTEQEQQAKATLIEHNLRLVVYIAKKFDNTGVGVEDLISIGTIGLIKAINTFNSGKNIKLATYASRCIENEILMYIRKIASHKSDVSLDEPINTDWDGNELHLGDVLGTEPDAVSRPLEDDVDLRLLREALDQLPDKEQTIVKLRYGIGGGREKTQKEVADILGISQSYISRLEKRIILRLRREITRQIY